MISITLIDSQGTRFFMGLVPATFDVAGWAARMRAPLKHLQIERIETQAVGTA